VGLGQAFRGSIRKRPREALSDTRVIARDLAGHPVVYFCTRSPAGASGGGRGTVSGASGPPVDVLGPRRRRRDAVGRVRPRVLRVSAGPRAARAGARS